MRILFVSSNSSEDYLDIEREQRTLLKLAEQGGHFLKLIPAATIDDLKKALGGKREEKAPRELFDVLHFAGHGTKKGIVLKREHDGDVEDEEGGPVLGADELREVVEEAKAVVGLKLVVLNACETQELAERIEELVEVVGTTKKVEDRTAKQFSRVFYDELSKDEETTVKAAFRKAATADGPYTRRPENRPSITLPSTEALGDGQIEGLGNFYNRFYGTHVDNKIGRLERDHRLNNYVFYGLLSIAVCVWIYLFQTGDYGISGGVFWENLRAALADAFYPGTEDSEARSFSMDGLWNRVQKLEAFAPVLIAFFQKTVFFQTGPKVAGLKRLREAIRNWDDLPEEDQETVRGVMHASLKESLQS